MSAIATWLPDFLLLFEKRDQHAISYTAETRLNDPETCVAVLKLSFGPYRVDRINYVRRS